jgi:hypothetical protein
MHWLRPIRALVPWLVGLFVVAQLAGAAPMQASAMPSSMAAQVHCHGEHGDAAPHHGSHDHRAHHPGAVDPADPCCALHAMAAIVPHVAEAMPGDFARTRLVARNGDRLADLDPPPLDRPPRS